MDFQWLWICSAPCLIAMFVNDPSSAGIYLSLGIASAAGAYVLAIGFINGLIKIVANRIVTLRLRRLDGSH
jgi:hypothetical protein